MSEEQTIDCFSADPEVYTFKLKNKDGVETLYELRELEGGTRDKYLNKERKKNSGNGMPMDFTNCQASLIAESMFVKETSEKVPLEQIVTLPSKTQVRLYEKCLEINGFEELLETPEQRAARKEKLKNS